MSKYIKLYDAIMAMDEWFSEPITPTQILSDLPTIEVSEDCISREYMKSLGYINKGDFNSVETIREWIDNAPSVVPTVRKNRTTAEPQIYITEDRDTQILDAWQVHHRNITTVEDEPTTEQSSRVGEWIAKDGVFYCSRCDNDSGLSEEDVDIYEMTLPNYCQDCGAKMKGADNE